MDERSYLVKNHCIFGSYFLVISQKKFFICSTIKLLQFFFISVATKNGRRKEYFSPLLFCCCCWIRDPRSGMDENQDRGSGIIPDPQHWPYRSDGNPGEEMWRIFRPEKLTENLRRQAVEKTCRLPQLEALSHPPSGGCTAPASRTVPTAARHRTVPPRRVRRRLMLARRAAGLGTGRTDGRGTTRRARRTDGRGTTRRSRRHLPRGYCSCRGVPAKVVCKIQIYLLSVRFLAVLRSRIRICGIHIFLDVPDPDPLVRNTDQDPSIIKQK